jgi:hypothetical protein
MTEKRKTSQGYIIRILQHFATKLRKNLSRSKFHSKGEKSIVEVCKSDPNPIGIVRISEPKYKFRIGLIKLFRSRIGSDFDIRINYPCIIARINYAMHLSKYHRGCRCIIRLILQLDVTLSASWYVFLDFIFIWLNISTWMRNLFYKRILRIGSDWNSFSKLGSDSD